MECVAEAWNESASEVESPWAVPTSSANQIYPKDDVKSGCVITNIANGMKTGRRYSLSEAECKQYSCRSLLVDGYKSRSAYFSRDNDNENKSDLRGSNDDDDDDSGGKIFKSKSDIFMNIDRGKEICRVGSVEGDRESALAGSCTTGASSAGYARRTHEFARGVGTKNVHFISGNIISVDGVNSSCCNDVNNGCRADVNKVNDACVGKCKNCFKNDVKCASVKDGDVMRPVRTRRTGVVTSPILERREFPCVERLVAKYTQLIAQQMERNQRYQKKKLHASEGDLKEVVSNNDSNIMKEEKDIRSTSQTRTYLALPSPRRSKRRSSCQSPSTASDEGCSVVPAPNSPTSSEEDASFQNKRCVSSDSALGFLYNSDDEERKRTAEERINPKIEPVVDSVVNDETNRLSQSQPNLHTNLNRSISMPTPRSNCASIDNVSSARSEITLCKEKWFLERSGFGDNGPLLESGWISGSRRVSDFSEFDGSTSDDRFNGRRESSVSVFTDDDESVNPGYRYWRTPSVVVSDHSDDPLFASSSITLEEIERFRQQYQERQASGDSSSDCSSWTSGVSALDADYALRTPERKASDCSTCSTLSGDEDATCEPLLQDVRPKVKPSGWRKLRNIVQWTPFFQTYKKQRYPWVQLAGHQGNFKAGPEPGTILKKLCPKEQLCFQVLMKDVLRPYVPEYKGHLTCEDGDGETAMYLQLQDLLGDFTNPCVMDCKVGVRTYLEEELAKAKEKPKLRKDMYEKMIQIDPNAPTDEEHRLKGVTKPRYMVWRETISSTATLGFRIEGIKKSDGKSSKDFKTTKTREQILECFADFTAGFPHAVPKYLQRLKAIKATLEVSDFFTTHEVIGSSLLFVHDQNNANVWLIDFAKTLILPSEMNISHSDSWVVGNHEDGYMIGVNNLISIFSELMDKQVAERQQQQQLQDNQNQQTQQHVQSAHPIPTTLVVTAPQDVT